MQEKRIIWQAVRCYLLKRFAPLLSKARRCKRAVLPILDNDKRLLSSAVPALTDARLHGVLVLVVLLLAHTRFAIYYMCISYVIDVAKTKRRLQSSENLNAQGPGRDETRLKSSIPNSERQLWPATRLQMYY
jgi:hypothetical protein